MPRIPTAISEMNVPLKVRKTAQNWNFNSLESMETPVIFGR